MDWVKLSTNYYLDPAVMRAGEAAEVLFTRGLAYSGDHETDGFIPAQAVPSLTPTRGRQRVTALVREGLWAAVEGGWSIPRFTEWQNSHARMQKARDGGRQRQQKWRARHNGVTNIVSDAVSTPSRNAREVEGEVEAAAAASADGPCELSDTVAIFRDKIHGITALQSLRFDLDPSQHARLELLIGVHGDAKLIDEAVRTLRQPSPTKVTAFLRTWEELRAPGEPLMRVVEPKCDRPGHELENVRNCRLCASEVKAGERAAT